MRTLGLEEEHEDVLMEEDPMQNMQVSSEDAPESAMKPAPVDKSTQTTPAPQQDASTATVPLPDGSSRGADNAAATSSSVQSAETAPAAPRRRAGRFRETVQVWDPSRLLAPTDGGAAPAHAVVLLNVPLHVDHLRTFEHLWNGGECHACFPCMHQADALAASYRVCADGGANRLFDAYFASPSSAEAASDPHAIVGDLDSLRPAVRHFFEARGVSILERPSQYATDLQKSIHAVEDVERAAPRSAPGVAASWNSSSMAVSVDGWTRRCTRYTCSGYWRPASLTPEAWKIRMKRRVRRSREAASSGNAIARGSSARTAWRGCCPR